MSIASDVQRIQQAKADIKTAIQGMGVTVPDTALISDLDTYVSNISSDADATADDLTYGKTAYVGGTKITGAKHWITGTVTGGSATTLSISGLGFTPKYLVLTIEGSVNTYGSYQYVFCINNTSGTVWGSYAKGLSYSSNYYGIYAASGVTTLTFGDGTISLSGGYFYATTYRYIAWN